MEELNPTPPGVDQGMRAPTPNQNNRQGLDYRMEAERLGAPPCPIIDVHAHVSGEHAARIYAEVADLFGVARVHSMTQLEDVPPVQKVLGDRVQFTAVPNWNDPDRHKAHGPDFLSRIERFHELGSRVVKIFAAPRLRDVETELGDPGLFQLDSPLRHEVAKLAERLGMMIMTHVADPDTWFRARYFDAEIYGTKREQYEPLERMLESYDVPWIAAHMGGSPEDLGFLDELLERHANLHLDTSACKWMIRELGSQETDDVRGFFAKWRGRVLFGSDIVTTDLHLVESKDASETEAKASGYAQAFDLYASRYWSLRSMFESAGSFESPIVDPDLHMIDPSAHAPTDAPLVRCHSIDPEILRDLYHDAPASLLGST
jgi:hypothetical protein